ncbi:putative zonadhesin isoform X2 [Penicillium digitatum]|uniref:Putative zonadhesin isoform X2 n=1 Tax=Penicillium digitatum TaxID=36651 RepID=A0A7T6XUB3_PENDI|nr:putative zonadhesin isoform X2 [Penicillium digitatum]
MEEQEATLLEKIFSQDELEAAKEEREEKLSEIEVDPISDTEEQEDELEDKPGDAIEVVIEDRPEDIPEERPLPTSEYGRPCSPSLPPTFCNPVWGPRPSTGSNPPTQTHYWVEGFDPKPNPDWVGSGLGLGFTGSCGRLVLVFWANVRRQTACHTTALQLAYESACDVVCIQEPYVSAPTKKTGHPAYDCYAPTDEWDSSDPTSFESERPRVFTYVRKNSGVTVRTVMLTPELNSGRPGPEQTATTEEPPATAEEPPATTEEPPATTEDPPATTEEPPATAEEPPATTEDPPATTEDPPATTEEPPATAEEPPATTEEPPATAEEPPATTEDPPATTEEPPATAEEPPATTEDPPATCKVPSEEPACTTNWSRETRHCSRIASCVCCVCKKEIQHVRNYNRGHRDCTEPQDRH